MKIQWTKSDYDQMRISTANASDMSRQENGAMELAFSAKAFNGESSVVEIGMCDDTSSCNKMITINISANDWKEYRISLSCFAKLGVDMGHVITDIHKIGDLVSKINRIDRAIRAEIEC